MWVDVVHTVINTQISSGHGQFWIPTEVSRYGEYAVINIQVDRGKTSPPGGFLCIPWLRAVRKIFYDEMRRSHLVVKSLTHGSWSGNIVNRNPPPGGGVSFDQSLMWVDVVNTVINTQISCGHGAFGIPTDMNRYGEYAVINIQVSCEWMWWI